MKQVFNKLNYVFDNFLWYYTIILKINCRLFVGLNIKDIIIWFLESNMRNYFDYFKQVKIFLRGLKGVSY